MSLRRLFQSSALVLASASAFGYQSTPTCAEGFDPNFSPTSHLPIPDGSVYASVIFDDGSGPKLYIGGSFGRIGNTLARGVARWDGESWSAVGTAWSGNGDGAFIIGHAVRALAVYDDGSGSALYAGGDFSTDASAIPSTKIARWDGLAWSVPGGGVNGNVNALLAHDDGSGVKLYAGGLLTTAGGQPAAHIACWDGVTWSGVDTGISGTVDCLASYAGGTVRRLYAGGRFETAGGVSAKDIARWDGANWSALGAGLTGPSEGVLSLHVFSDGTASKLIVGGYFQQVAGLTANSIAAWDGTNWSTFGTGFNGDVRALTTWDDGHGPALIAGGFLFPVGGDTFGLNRWNGTTWTGVGGDVGTFGSAVVQMLRVHDDGHGTRLFVGGGFNHIVGGVPGKLATWNGTSWNALGTPPAAYGIQGSVLALATHDDGSGRALFAGGFLSAAGGQPARNVARWNGSAWSPLGFGLDNGICDALLSYDLGSGSTLFASGTFTAAGGQAVLRIASWNGTSWSALSGLSGGVLRIRALQGFDDGSGPAVFIAGSLVTDVAPALIGIGRWDGSAWSALGGGLGGGTGDVHALAVFDDGTGPALFAGGRFGDANGMPVNNIARWNGTAWSTLGNGVGIAGSADTVRALCVFDDGTGPALYAGGSFSQASGVSAAALARWNGTSWSAVPGALSGTLVPAPIVYSLRLVDDGSGPALSVGGRFSTAAGVSASSLSRWNGTDWSSVGVGVGGASFTPNVGGGIGDISMPVVYAQEFFDDGSGGGADLYVGGAFRSAGGYLSLGFARWNTCAETFTNFCAGDGSATACPCSNSGAVGHGCATSANANGALLVASGTPSIAAGSVVLNASELPVAFASVFQGTLQAGSGLGITFGDGLLCVAGTLTRIATRFAPGGNLQYPGVRDAPLSVGGGVPVFGGARAYQVWYRDSLMTYCTPATFNFSNAVRFTWSP